MLKGFPRLVIFLKTITITFCYVSEYKLISTMSNHYTAK